MPVYYNKKSFISQIFIYAFLHKNDVRGKMAEKYPSKEKTAPESRFYAY